MCIIDYNLYMLHLYVYMDDLCINACTRVVIYKHALLQILEECIFTLTPLY